MTYCHSSAFGCQWSSRNGPRFEVQDYAGDCCRNWKSRGIDAPFAPAFENRVRRTRKHSKLVRLGWRDAWTLEILRYRRVLAKASIHRGGYNANEKVFLVQSQSLDGRLVDRSSDDQAIIALEIHQSSPRFHA
jgi:hypothetical protein